MQPGLIEVYDRQRKGAARKGKVLGVCVHTTGTGVVEAAKSKSLDPTYEAVRRYLRPGEPFAHAVIGTDGRVVQVAPFERIAWHAGITDAQAKLYASGAWRKRVAPEALALWDARWPGKKGPLDIVAGPWNHTLIGVELVPTGSAKYVGADKVYTGAQYESLVLLIDGLREMFGDLVLVGHEDIEPLERCNAGGGWDPGAMRLEPWFDWGRL